MKNPNALITMAHVSQNASNPYAVFCEYIKYCIFASSSDTMPLTAVRDAVGHEFGLHIPHNAFVRCISYLKRDGLVSIDAHQIKRVGSFDITAFDAEREKYRETENAVITKLISFVARFNREWTVDHARECLIGVLDRNGLAYEIFIHDNAEADELSDLVVSDINNDILPDDEETDVAETNDQPLYTDSFFVGKFLTEVLSSDSIYRDYLRRICEGLMLCVGAYQLPSSGIDSNIPSIRGTHFYFDTKLLLRYVGCAGSAAVTAVHELITLIQENGGLVYYYPQTLEEMDRTFEKAVQLLSQGYTPHDEEMRLYAASVRNDISIIKAKKASFRNELSAAHIYLKPNEEFDDNARIQYGFDKNDLQTFMANQLTWEPQAIANDALAIWETHMRRRGNYEEYCGTTSQLPVFLPQILDS